ncbi:hypothetical protein CBP34_06335 [Acidovorax carolinensis]|uniref:DUF2442 domain-containing protein n=1 Tax=Acidovorax carolinensis TaxID=553814 RepID=A0A240U0F6_9BURK|nr:DUF2442 domain-containing protein [Acidovorax carolinensis]ART51359.1 hypothetical protein CBP34_06335 [Acidovorax carolinensis]
MIKVLNVHHAGPWKLELEFSDHTHGLFDAAAYLANHQGPLLEALREAAYFDRVFIDAGALCWPNGLEISPARLRELVTVGVET